MRVIKRNRESGMAAVEFAMVLPVFMMLLFAVVEFGSAFYKQQIITSAAREAARAGVVATDPRPSAGQIATRARAFLDSAGLDSAQSTVAVVGAGGFSGDELAIEVNYPADFKMLSKFVAVASTNGAGTMSLNSRIVVELE